MKLSNSKIKIIIPQLILNPPSEQSRICAREGCGEPVTSKRPDAQFCGLPCKNKHHYIERLKKEAIPIELQKALKKNIRIIKLLKFTDGVATVSVWTLGSFQFQEDVHTNLYFNEHGQNVMQYGEFYAVCIDKIGTIKITNYAP